jgi:hypothetical protein
VEVEDVLLDEFLNRSHGQAPMEDSGWESGARLPPATNVTQQCDVPAPRIDGGFQMRDVAGGAYESEELRRFIGSLFSRELESSIALTEPIC